MILTFAVRAVLTLRPDKADKELSVLRLLKGLKQNGGVRYFTGDPKIRVARKISAPGVSVSVPKKLVHPIFRSPTHLRWRTRSETFPGQNLGPGLSRPKIFGGGLWSQIFETRILKMGWFWRVRRRPCLSLPPSRPSTDSDFKLSDGGEISITLLSRLLR